MPLGFHHEKAIVAEVSGTLSNKQLAIQNSSYYLCIENTLSQNGYITEKIFDAFRRAQFLFMWRSKC